MSNTLMSFFLKNIKNENFVLSELEFKNPQTNEMEKIFKDLHVVDNKSRVTFIFGDNASGKSFIGRWLEMAAKQFKDKYDTSTRNVSVANRTSSGPQKAMIFGDEASQSTGETSFSVVKLGLDSIKKEEKPSILILDEPELGLSPKYSKTFARYIVDQLESMDENKQIVIVSHNTIFIEAVLKHYNKPVNELGINVDGNLKDWVEDDTEYSIEDLMMLKEFAEAKWRSIMLKFDF